MKKTTFLALMTILLMTFYGQKAVFGQSVEVRQAVSSDVSIPLRDMKPVKHFFWEKWMKETEKEVPNKFRPVSPFTVADNAVQAHYYNGNKSVNTAPLINFNGLNNGNNTGGRVTPPDPAGDVGPNHYVQAVNCMLQIFSKTGTSLYGPVTTSTLWSGFSGNWTGHNDGDAVVLYDENADRWIVSQFAVDCAGTPYTEYQLVAVSTTPDPTGSYYRYAFQFDYMPDYPKMGVWNDGYYMSVNRFNTNTSGAFVGAGACVLDRTKMLAGDPTATMQYFKTETLGGSGSTAGGNCYSMLPSDCDGTMPAAGTPNYFFYDDQASSELRIWAFHADFTTPANSTFTYNTKFTVAAYTELGSVAQQGTTNTLDGLGDRLMFRNQYRNFGSYETFVTCRNVTTGGAAAIRWYELRKVGSTLSIYQQSTFAPGDGKSRWMGSIAMNSAGDIGLAYSVSSSTMYPSIYFTGRKAADPLNQLTIPEGIIQTGTASITGATRWGDYTATNIDPSDGQTFWTTQEYVGTFGGTWPWATKIASFKFASTPVVTTLAATAITGTSATLNGTVNPNGFASNYYFEWGTTTSYGSSTTSTAAGSGTTAIPVSAPLSGLIAGTTYHFRLTGVNSEGTASGNDLTFTPGAAVVTTAATTGITLTAATSGGTVVSDGGYSITARGVCYGTTASPIISGPHTTDGSGLGTFPSSITGLTSNTTYHVRAYATNSSGTYYGDDIQFTTLCSIFTLPFSESFSGTIIPNCWSVVDNQGNGEIWQFGLLTGQSVTPALTGNYAYLNSRGYGTGNTQNTDLITPVLDLTGYTAVTLQFNHYYRSRTGSSGTLSYSINGGSTWTTIQSFTTTSTNPAAFSQVVAAVAGQSAVKFKWNYTGTYGYYWSVDDVLITGTTSSPTLSVTPPNQNVTIAAGTTPYTVTSNSAWTATSNSAWCTVTPSGTGNGTITATYTANVGTLSRVANITVTVTGLTPVTVTVTQDGTASTITVTPANQNVTAPAGTTPFTVTTGASWTATSNFAWCTVTPSGTGNGTITATYTTNGGASSRVANITVTATGLTPVIVTVTQAGTAPTLTVTPPNQNVTSPAGTAPFVVTTASNWTATSDAAWCTVTASGTGNGTLTATYTTNSGASRVANITVTVTGLTPVVVTLTQASGLSLTVTPPNQNVTTAAGTTPFTVTTTAAWTAVSDAVSWCTVTPSGTGNGTLTATYLQNTAVTSRVANITVTVTGLTSVVVTVTQAAATPILSVTPSNQNVTAPAGSTNFSVTSNTTWSVSSDATWCTVPASGSGNGSLTATYAQNTAVSSRVANLTFIVSGLPPVQVTVTQAGASPSLMVTPAYQNVDAVATSTNFTVTSNVAWTAVSDAAWCTVTSSGSGNGTIVATATANPNVDNRTANITVTASGVPSVTVMVNQSGTAPLLSVTPPNQNVLGVSGATSFTVTSNSFWTVQSDVSWCSVTPSGSGNGILSATYEANPLVTQRIANITVTVNGIVPVIVTVTQAGGAASLLVTPPSQNVTMPAGSAVFNVASNASWVSTSDVAWCTVTPSGSGNGLINAIYTVNNGPVIRTANITVTVAGINPQVVQVVQLPSFVSVGEQPSSTLKVFPNPTSGVFSISSASRSDLQMNVTILDEIGQVVLSRHCTGQTSYTFDLSASVKGNYLVKAETAGKILVWKLIIQ